MSDLIDQLEKQISQTVDEAVQSSVHRTMSAIGKRDLVFFYTEKEVVEMWKTSERTMNRLRKSGTIDL